MNQQIIEYHLYAAEVDESGGGMRCPLTASANEFIKDCWQPYGNPFVFTSVDGVSRICQAFVKNALPTQGNSAKPRPHRLVGS